MECETALINNTANWFDLPYDVRNMIIETMDTKTKLKFAVCSKQCDEEVKLSHNFLELFQVHHQMYEHTDLKCTSLRVKTSDLNMVFMVCNNVVWRKELDDDMDDENVIGYEFRIVHENIPQGFEIFEMADREEDDEIDKEFDALKIAQYFNEILKYASNSSVKLAIGSDFFPYENTNIRHLRFLKSFEDLDFRTVTEELPEIDLMESGFLTFAQLKHITGPLQLSNVRLSLDQVFELRAECVIANSAGITSQQLNELLKSWKRGVVNLPFGIVKINKIEPQIDEDVLTNELGVEIRSTRAILASTPIGRSLLGDDSDDDDDENGSFFQLKKIRRPRKTLLVKYTSNSIDMYYKSYVEKRVMADFVKDMRSFAHSLGEI